MMDEARKKLAAIVRQAILVNAWSDENCLKIADRILAMLKSEGVLKEDGDAATGH